MSQRVRYTVNDVNNNRFYQMPKFLFEGEFKALSNDARVLYSLLRDRHALSLSNNWINDNNEVYLIYTRENMAEMLGCTQPTLRKIIEQLKSHILMEEERKGLNRANYIYLTAVSLDMTGLKDSYSPDCKNLSVKTVNSFQSRTVNSFSQDCKILSANNTDINNTDIINTNINDTDHHHLEGDDEGEIKKVDNTEGHDEGGSENHQVGNIEGRFPKRYLEIAKKVGATEEDLAITLEKMDSEPDVKKPIAWLREALKNEVTNRELANRPKTEKKPASKRNAPRSTMAKADTPTTTKKDKYEDFYL